jgi:hypothetical protein
MDALLGPLAPFIVFGGVAWVGIAIGIGLLAERRGSSGLVWFALAVVTTPILAPLLLILAPLLLILAPLLLLAVAQRGGESGRR